MATLSHSGRTLGSDARRRPESTPAIRVGRIPWLSLAIIPVTFVLLNVVVVAAQPALLRIAMRDYQHTVAKVMLYEDGPRPDIIFMGNSRALNAFNPGLTESEIAHLTGTRIHALNLAISGSTINLNYLVLKNIIRDDKKPRIIVYGLSESELGEGGNASRQLPYFSLLLRPDDCAQYCGPNLSAKLQFGLTTLCPICRDADLIRNGLSIAFNPDDPFHKFYGPGPQHLDPAANGYFWWPARSHAPPAGYRLERSIYGPALDKYRYGQTLFVRFRAFLRLAHERGIKVLVVNLPVTSGLKHLWRTKARMDRYVHEVRSVTKASGVPLLDLYKRGDRVIPAAGFYDQVHLNELGSNILTRMVVTSYLAPWLRQAHGGR